MAKKTAGQPVPILVGPTDISISCNSQAFVFPPGHRMRAGHCLLCRQLIGGAVTTIIQTVSFDPGACDCGSVESDAFIIHVSHLPVPDAELQAAIHRGLHCGNNPHLTESH
jgi:hypothetical protein